MHFNLDHWSSVRDHTERKEVCRIMCGNSIALPLVTTKDLHTQPSVQEPDGHTAVPS